MAIRTIIFDFGNVLAHFSHRKAAEQLAAYGPPGLTADAVLDFVFKGDLEPRFEVAAIDGPGVLALLRKELGLGGSDDELAHAASDMFSDNDDILTAIPHLREKYRLVLLSNTNEYHYRHFRARYAAALDHFHHLITSHEVRLRKPDPAIFRHAQELAHCRPDEVLYVDDLAANIEAGRAAGWNTIHYVPGTDLRAELARHGVTLP